MSTHTAKVWLQIEGKVRPIRSYDPGYKNDGTGAQYAVESVKVVTLTQSRPQPPRRGCIAMQVSIEIPDAAFLPLMPRAVIAVPAEFVIHGDAIEATVTDPGEDA